MKTWIKQAALGLVAVFSFLGINVGPSSAAIQNKDMQIKENTPLYLEHGSTILANAQQNNSQLAWHYSHSSHMSHESHASHVSHYSSRY